MPELEGYLLTENGYADINAYIDKYNQIFRTGTPWVLFSNGTCVVPTDRTNPDKIIDNAINILRPYKNFASGNPRADFVVFQLSIPGFLIKLRDPIYVYVAPLNNPGPKDVLAGIIGRAVLTLDAQSLEPAAIAGKHILDAEKERG